MVGVPKAPRPQTERLFDGSGAAMLGASKALTPPPLIDTRPPSIPNSKYTSAQTPRLSRKADLLVRAALYSVIAVVSALALYGAGVEESYAQTADSVPAFAQKSIHRGISDSLSVTAAFGSPGAPNHYTRAISEGINISTSIPAQPQQVRTPADSGNAFRTTSSYSPSPAQRSDERLTFRNLGKMTTTSIGGTSYNSPVSSFSGSQEVQVERQGEQVLQELLNASGDGETDDHLQLARSMAAVVTSGNNQFYYQSGLYGSYSITLIGLVACRSPFLRMLAMSSVKLAGPMAITEKNRKIVSMVASIALAGAVSTVVFPVVETVADEDDDFEGLTPGFWKNNAAQFGAVAWVPTGYTPDTKFADVFGVVINGSPNLTLLDTLDLQGGGVNALARHAVAALLNSAHPDINYPLDTADVITMVADAISSGNNDTIEDLKDQLDQYNNLGGGIDQHGNPLPGAATSAISDSVAISDAATSKITSVAVSDSVGVSDSIKQVSASSGVAISAYKSGTGGSNQNIIRYREFNLSTQQWSDEVDVFNVGNPIRDLKILYSPVSDMRTIASLSRNGDLNVLVCDVNCTEPDSWTRLGGSIIADVGSPGDSRPWRPFDIAFEDSSGRLIIVYDKNLREADDFYYRIYDGQSLSQEFGVNYNGEDNDMEDIVYFRLASRPGSDEMALVFVDRSAKTSVAYIWDPANDTFRDDSKLVLATEMERVSLDRQAVAIAYESTSGATVVASAEGEDSVLVSRWAGSSWSQPISTDPNTAEESATVFLSMKPDPSSDKIMLCQSDDKKDLSCAEINSGSMGPWNIMDTDLDTDSRRAFDFAWDASGSTGVLLFGTSDDQLHYSRWDGSSWNTASVSYEAKKNWIVGATNFLDSNEVKSLFLVLNTRNDIGSVKYDGQEPVVIGTGTHTTQTSTNTEVLSIDFKKSKKSARHMSDSIAVTDDVVAKVVARAISDEVAITDTLTAKVTARAVVDSVTLVDTIATGVSRSTAETISVSDTVDRIYLALRSVLDNVGITDSITMSVSRSTDDSLALTDSISTSVTRSVSDSLAVSDSAAGTLQAPRSPSDSVTTVDAIIVTKSVSRPADDSIGIADGISISVSKLASDSVSIADSISARVTRPISDELEVTDVVSMHVSRSLSDSLEVHSAVSTTAHRPASDEIELTDAISLTVSRQTSVTETIEIDDAITKSVTKQAAETLDIHDTIAMRVSRSVSEDLNVDEEVSISTTRTANEFLTVTDSISKAFAKQTADEMAVTDSISFTLTRAISDSIGISDDIERPKIPLNDPISVTDSAVVTVVHVRAIADTITVGDSIFQPPTPKELVTVTDSISIGLYRNIQDSIGTADEVRRGRFVQIGDSLQVLPTLTDVSWTRTLGIVEPLTLSSEVCLPTLCLHNPSGLTMGIGLQDSLQLVLTTPPKMSETVAVSDSIVAGKTFGKQPGDSPKFTDKITTVVKPKPPAPLAGSPLPPISVLIVDNKTNVSVPPSVSVPITLNWSGNVTQLKELVKPAPHVINATVNEALLPQKTMVLPTYHMPNTPTKQLPGKDVLMSVMAAKIPKDSPVMVPINVADTPEMAERKKFTHSMVVEFTPAVDTTNFALVVTPMDEPPGSHQPPQADLKPLYLDVRWIGDFPGVEDPSVSAYYKDPPKFTFTVTDEWANKENAQRDENGVPLVSLSLLNESTGVWETIATITRPTAREDGVYTYVATLPHFSSYAITANKVVAGAGGGGGGAAVPSTPALYTRQLTESISVQEATQNAAVTIIEEFLKPKKVSVFVSDLVSITTKPVALIPEIKVDQDVTINMRVQEVKQADLPKPMAVIDALTNPSADLTEKLEELQRRLLTDLRAVIDVFARPSALAEIVVQIKNTGIESRQFALDFTYSDAQGNVLGQTGELEVDGGTTLTRRVELPFTEPGTYVVTVEVRNLPGGDIAGFSTLAIQIPWLSLYLYMLLAAAGAILGISGISVVILVRKRPEIAAGAGAAGAAYKKKRRIRLFARDEQEFKKNHRYDVLARLELRNMVSSDSQLKAVFALDVWSKKEGKEFIVTYRAVDASEKIVHESHVLVPAVSDLQSLSIVIPFDEPGQYTIYAEARFEVGGDVLDSTKLAVQVGSQ